MTFRHLDREPCDDCDEPSCLKRELMKQMVPGVTDATAWEYGRAMGECLRRMQQQRDRREDEWRMGL